jgi:ATP-dependent RNA helicase MRH4, mitochondrial
MHNALSKKVSARLLTKYNVTIDGVPMHLISRSKCIICEYRSIIPTLNARYLPPVSLRWTLQTRSIVRARARRPSRMELSPNVSKSRVNNQKDSKAKGSRGRDGMLGPFAGMNRRSFQIPDDERTKSKPSRSASNRNQRLTGQKEKSGGREEYKALKMQRVLAHVGYGKRSRVKKEISSVTSFDGFPLLPVVRESILSCALPEVGDAVPTPIQRLAIPALLEAGKRRRAKVSEGLQQYLLAAETGSGKTLAYMVPIIDWIKKIESSKEDEEETTLSANQIVPENPDLFALEELAAAESRYPHGKPRGIILLPTSELVDQVGKVAKAFSHKVKFRATLISSAYSPTVIRNRLSNPGGMDLLITTPQLLSNIAQSNPAILSRVSHLVVDEADSLLDRSFEPFTTTIIERAMPTLRQLVMCSATIPRRMDGYLRKRYPDIIRLTTPNLHAIPRRVQLNVVDTSKNNYFNNKDLACADTIWKIGHGFNEPSEEPVGIEEKTRRIMVFVNEREKTIELAEYLRSKGIDARSLNRDADARQERNLLAEFQGETVVMEGSHSPERFTGSKSGRTLQNTKVVVVTDLASRGIDTTAVRDVILYDVPHTSIDFIHRLGRTGRMGRRGRGYVLVGKDDRKDVVSEIRHGMYRGQALI